MEQENHLEKFLDKESIIEDAALAMDNLEEASSYYVGGCGCRSHCGGGGGCKCRSASKASEYSVSSSYSAKESYKENSR